MHDRLDAIIDVLLPPIAAILGALLVGAIMLLLLGANPIAGYVALFQGAFGSTNSIADTAVKATPLLLVGIGICISFRGGVINIGGEGQMILGALGAIALGLIFPTGPGWLIITLALLVGFAAGGLWGGIPGYLKARYNVNEILSTIMMNAIAVQLMNLLLRGPMIDTAQKGAARIPQTPRLADAFDLPRLIPTRLHLGTLLAIILAFVVYFFLWRTTIGYRIRAVGLNPHASRYSGINVQHNIVLSLLLSGAFAGLAGAVQVYGVNHFMTC
jgi:simple sugar transport system permease protein